ncbi:hypothetical protein Taro_050347 [Colocasia esculenta]|uniref:MLO-like protein n=1 Tax=Colocasia esculenta TaxID=4460 RepID=A0A843XDL7_COLES|nr:hypothetical protein [Colocasia esculenta]
MAGGGGGDRPLTETPAWAVALVCAVIVVVSVVIEHGIGMLHKLFQRRQKKAMLEALEKIKAELMLLGFISLLLTVGQQPISRICVSSKVGHSMLPCKKATNDGSSHEGGDGRRKLLVWFGSQEPPSWRRVLAGAAGASTDYCSKYEGKVSLISQTGIHQLHIFIFVLAIFHVLYSALTMGLAQAKKNTLLLILSVYGFSTRFEQMRTWKAWESETDSLEYQFSYDPTRFRLTRQTSFVKRHVGLSSKPGIKWIVAFFRQFLGSVTKIDYLTMRHGFINAHLSPNSKFNFHKYIKRSLEDDFKVSASVVSRHHVDASQCTWYTIHIPISSFHQIVVLILSIIASSVNVLLLVGTKLEMVIMEMAHEIQDRTSVVKGAPVVEPSNRFFWFSQPKWILYLIQFTLFEYSFGLRSCFHVNLPATIARVALGLALQFVCSYITFPLYALVTQMGSHMKKAIFEEQTARALEKWRLAAKARRKQRQRGEDNSRSGYFSGGETTPSRGTSPIHLLHKNNKSSSGDVESVLGSPRYYQSDGDMPDQMELPAPFTRFQVPGSRTSSSLQQDNHEEHVSGCDFSFSTAS